MLRPPEAEGHRQAYDVLSLQFNKLLSPILLMAIFKSNIYRKNFLIESKGQGYSQVIENGKYYNFEE